MPGCGVASISPAEHDLANRLPVWVALSELYLDTELSANDFEHLAETLAASPYSAQELRYILLAEVHPVCVRNRLQIAGVWSGFDPGWLREHILRRRRVWLRWPARFLPFRNATLSRMVPLLIRVASVRAQSGSERPFLAPRPPHAHT